MYRKIAWCITLALGLLSGCIKVKPLPEAPPFEYTFGGKANELAGTVIEAPTGDGVLLVGGSVDEEKGDYDLYLVRIDLDGNELWSRKIGEKGIDEIGYRALRSTTGQYVIFGTKADHGQYNPAEIQFTYLDDEFNVVRQTTTPTVLTNTGLVAHNAFFTQLSDGGFMACFSNNDYPITMRFDANGEMIDEESLGDYPVEKNRQVMARRPDGGFALAVKSSNTYSGYNSVQILLLDQFGNYQSLKPLPTYFSFANPLAISRFGLDRYVLSLMTYSDSGNHALVLLDSAFNTVWTSITNDEPYYHHIGESSQHRILMTGDETSGINYGAKNMHAMVYDSLGVYVRTASYGGPSIETLRAAVAISSGKTVLLGETQSYGNGGTDLYVIFYQE